VAQSTGGCATAKPRGHCRAQPDFGTARNGGIDGGRVGETRQGNTLRHTGADVCSRYGIGALDSNKARMVHALHSLTYFRGPSDVS
jgi:hypothetical protein